MTESPVRNKRTWTSLARLKPYTQPYRRDAVSIAVAIIVSLPPTIAIPLLVTQLFATSDATSRSRPIVVMALLGLCVIAGALASWWRGAAVARLRVKSLHRIRIAALRALRRTELDQVARDAASTDVRLSEDLTQVAQALPDTWIGVAGSLIQSGAALILLAMMAPKLLVACLLGVGAIGGVSWMTSRPLRTASATFNAAHDRSRSRVSDSIRHESLLRSAHAESTDLMELVRDLAETARFSLRRDLLGLALGHPIVILSGIFPLALLAVGALDQNSSSIGAGALIASFILMGQMFDGVARIANVHSSLQTVIPALDRVMAIVDLAVAHPAARGHLTPESFRGVIQFDHVFAGYDGKAVLHDISFQTHAAEHIAIVGRSGSGKSTLLGLLWRAREPLSGSILIAGHSLRDIDPAALRRRVAVLPQDTPLLDRTFRQNLVLACPFATEGEIHEVVQRVELGPVVHRLPQGLESPIGTRGSNLSGGERSRLALARELLKRPDIVLLDEATSQLDPITEHAVLAGIDALTVGRTTFVIAHRMETARRSDRILVLEDGRVVGFGNHEELVRTCTAYQALRLAESMKDGPTT